MSTPTKDRPWARPSGSSATKADEDKHCKCVKSKCLKLYCQCFARGDTCDDECVCVDCHNAKDWAGGGDGGETSPKTFKYAAGTTAAKKPRELDAVKPKKEAGCRCKNSKCLKKYCECFSSERECSGRCQCAGCENPHGKTIGVSSSAAAKLAAAGVEVPFKAPEDLSCKCTKTHCLKLYCDCFRQDAKCNPLQCRCIECHNTEAESGPGGARTKAREEILKSRPNVFQTPKKKSGGGCNCKRNKCITKYCDCNATGTGCDPAVCTCINCENMMKPKSEMEFELQEEDEDDTEVFIPSELEKKSKIKGLEDFVHMIDGFEGRRVADPSEKLNIAYVGQEMAAEKAKEVIEEETTVRSGIEAEIETLEAQLEQSVKQESAALETYREKTVTVMALEMEEPCRWNSTYQRLKQYVMKTGDMPPVPSACATEEDRRLSIWVQQQKSLYYSKSEQIMNYPHRVEALEMLGMEWIETSEERWNSMYKKLDEYKRRTGSATLPPFMQCRKTKDKSLIALRHWMDQQEQDVESGDILRRRDRLQKLQALGLPLKLTWEQEWEYNVTQLLIFRSKYGHLDVARGNDSDLVSFVNELLARLKRGSKEKLSKDEMLDLRAKGLFDGLKELLDRDANGGNTGPLIAEDVKLAPLNQVREVNYWAGMLEQLKAYQAQFNTLDFPPPRGAGNHGKGSQYTHLSNWVEEQRRAYHNKRLGESRVNSLANLGLDFDPWDNAFQRLKRFKEEAGTARLPKQYRRKEGEEKDEEMAHLINWLESQTRIYRQGGLKSDRKRQLREMGVVLTKRPSGKIPWEDRFDEMMDFYHKNKTCLPQRKGPLRDFVLELVDLLQNGFVSAKRQKLIDEARIGPYLRPEIVFMDPGQKKKRKASARGGASGKRTKTDDVVVAV